MSVWERAMREADVRVELPGGEVMCFRKIPACPEGFLMGSRGCHADEEPRHRVVIGYEFYLGTFVVTQGQYRVLEAAVGERLRAGEFHHDEDAREFRGDRYPIGGVFWKEASIVCDWLSESGLLESAGLPSGWRARLPTEAEWEYACRAGTLTEYYTGDGEAALEAVGWYRGNASGETHPVDEKEEAHPFGLYGMHGNVAEWCLERWDGPVYRTRPDPWIIGTAPDVAEECVVPVRMLRGGSWFRSAWDCRSGARDGCWPGNRRRELGFRVCLVSGPPVLAGEESGSGEARGSVDGI